MADDRCSLNPATFAAAPVKPMIESDHGLNQNGYGYIYIYIDHSETHVSARFEDRFENRSGARVLGPRGRGPGLGAWAAWGPGPGAKR